MDPVLLIKVFGIATCISLCIGETIARLAEDDSPFAGPIGAWLNERAERRTYDIIEAAERASIAAEDGPDDYDADFIESYLRWERATKESIHIAPRAQLLRAGPH